MESPLRSAGRALLGLPCDRGGPQLLR